MIRDRGVAHRYAAALFGAARKLNAESAVLADLRSLELLQETDPTLQDFLEAPEVLTEHKSELIESVLGGKVHELVVRLLQLMLIKKRIQHLPLVFQDYREMVEEHLGLLRGNVTTAIPLNEELSERLRVRLEKMTGKKVRLEARVDPSIIGGVIVTIGGKIVNASLRHQLDELGDTLRATQLN